MQPFIQDGVFWSAYPEINEISWGEHEGKPTSAEMRQNYLMINEEWKKGNYHARVPGGESAAELEKRLRQFFDILLSEKAERVLICTHGRTLSAICCILEARPLSDMYLFKHHNTGLTQAIYTPSGFEILRQNDTTHLVKHQK